VTRFLDLETRADDNHFIERSIAISPIPLSEAGPARAEILAAIPAKTGRVIRLLRDRRADGRAQRAGQRV
jgi:hypothetical protein